MSYFKIMLLSTITTAMFMKPITEIYEPGNHKRIYFQNNTYLEESYDGLKNSNSKYQTIRNCLELIPNFDVSEVDYPDDIEGITKDIPYNYKSQLDLSSKFLYSLIFQGWEIEYYKAEPDVIKLNLIRDTEKCRVVIYKDYLKVYQKSKLSYKELK